MNDQNSSANFTKVKKLGTVLQAIKAKSKTEIQALMAALKHSKSYQINNQKTTSMKYPLNLATVLVMTASLGLISCNSTPNEKVDAAQENVDAAQVKLDELNATYEADIATYKQENATRIAANEQSMAEFKSRIKSEKKSAKSDYNERIADLEKQNTDLKKTLDHYKADGKENWEAFKTEFNHDMDELGGAFKDLTVNNTK